MYLHSDACIPEVAYETLKFGIDGANQVARIIGTYQIHCMG